MWTAASGRPGAGGSGTRHPPSRWVTRRGRSVLSRATRPLAAVDPAADRPAQRAGPALLRPQQFPPFRVVPCRRRPHEPTGRPGRIRNAPGHPSRPPLPMSNPALDQIAVGHMGQRQGPGVTHYRPATHTLRGHPMSAAPTGLARVSLTAPGGTRQIPTRPKAAGGPPGTGERHQPLTRRPQTTPPKPPTANASTAASILAHPGEPSHFRAGPRWPTSLPADHGATRTRKRPAQRNRAATTPAAPTRVGACRPSHTDNAAREHPARPRRPDPAAPRRTLPRWPTSLPATQQHRDRETPRPAEPRRPPTPASPSALAHVAPATQDNTKGPPELRQRLASRCPRTPLGTRD